MAKRSATQNGYAKPASRPSSDAITDMGMEAEQAPLYGRMLLHLGSAAYMIYGFQSLSQLAIGKVMAPQYGGFFQYLTIIGLFSTIVLLVFCAAQAASPHRPVFVPIRRALLLFALPVECVISVLYWGIVLTRPDLMFPPKPLEADTPEPSSSDEANLLFRIPLWMDISMHLAPAIVLVIHFFCFEKRFRAPATTLGAASLAVGFGASYTTWMEHCAKQNGRFPYPFLDVMRPDERAAMYVGSVVLSLCAFWGLNALHR